MANDAQAGPRSELDLQLGRSTEAIESRIGIPTSTLPSGPEPPGPERPLL